MRSLRRLAATSRFGGFGRFGRYPCPPFSPATGRDTGTLAFDYGVRTVRLLSEIDEAEAGMVVQWLGRRLPAGAVGS